MLDQSSHKEISKSEYWILDSVLNRRYPLSLLLSPNAGLHFNKPDHDLSRADLLQVLQKLFKQGSIAGGIQPYSSWRNAAVTPNPQQIEAGLDGDMQFDFGLTPKGGELWEQVSNPSWKHFINQSYDGAERLGRLTCNDGLKLAEVLTMQPYFGYVPMEWSEEWEKLEPWSATYWKDLPVGYSVQFRYELIDTNYMDYKTRDRIRQWSRSHDHWYSNPFSEES